MTHPAEDRVGSVREEGTREEGEPAAMIGLGQRRSVMMGWDSVTVGGSALMMGGSESGDQTKRQAHRRGEAGVQGGLVACSEAQNGGAHHHDGQEGMHHGSRL